MNRSSHYKNRLSALHVGEVTSDSSGMSGCNLKVREHYELCNVCVCVCVCFVWGVAGYRSVPNLEVPLVSGEAKSPFSFCSAPLLLMNHMQKEEALLPQCLKKHGVKFK